MKKVLIVIIFTLVLFITISGIFVNKVFNEKNEEIDRLEEKNDKPIVKKYIFKKIELDDLLNKLDNKESFVLFISQDGCSHCQELKPIFKNIAKEYNLTVYFIDVDLLQSNDKDRLKNEVYYSVTPTIINVKDGEEIDRLVGFTSEEEFLEKLNDINIIKLDTIVVPDVSGKTKKEALKIFKEKGFKVADKQIEIRDDKIGEGLVVKTIPSAGTKRVKGAVVTLYISTGKEELFVEDYTGKNYLEVKCYLEEHGIYVYVEKKEVKETKKYEVDQIIEQSVKPGEKIGARDSITLYIPRVDEKYPDFTDGTYNGKVDEIQTFCDDHGVTLVIEEVGTSAYNPGTIISQSRSAGSIVDSGTTLKIKVAK